MLKCLFTVPFLALSFLTFANAADYTVRLEMVERTLNTDKNPKEQILNTIEVLCHPGMRSVAEATMGKETVRCNLRLRPTLDENEFILEFTYRTLKDRGVFGPPDSNGQRKPVLDQVLCSNTLTLQLNKSLVVSDSITSRAEKGKQILRTAMNISVLVKEFKPLDDEPTE